MPSGCLRTGGCGCERPACRSSGSRPRRGCRSRLLSGNFTRSPPFSAIRCFVHALDARLRRPFQNSTNNSAGCCGGRFTNAGGFLNAAGFIHEERRWGKCGGQFHSADLSEDASDDHSVRVFPLVSGRSLARNPIANGPGADTNTRQRDCLFAAESRPRQSSHRQHTIGTLATGLWEEREGRCVCCKRGTRQPIFFLLLPSSRNHLNFPTGGGWKEKNRSGEGPVFPSLKTTASSPRQIECPGVQLRPRRPPEAIPCGH